jgi:hypothetical protein
MEQDFRNYNELRAHYMAVRKRLGGLGSSPGLVPISLREDNKTVSAPPQKTPTALWQVDHIPNNNFRELLIRTADKYGIHPQQILNPGRKRDIIKIRAEVIYHAMRKLNYSSLRVGNWLNKDHKTILHALKSYEQTHAPTA